MKNVNIENKWKEFFSKAAENRGKDNEIAGTSENASKYYLKYFLNYFSPHSKKDNSQTKLLDLGCGSGTYLKLFYNNGFQVYGTDYSKEVIHVAEERVSNKKIKLVTADIYNLPFSDNYFDMIVCLNVFQTVDKPSLAMKEIKRVLKGNGLLIIMTLNRFSVFLLFSKNQSRLQKYNPYEFKSMIGENDFYDIKIKGIYFFTPLLEFITEAVAKHKIYKFFNFFFPLFMFFSHAFYIEGKRE